MSTHPTYPDRRGFAVNSPLTPDPRHSAGTARPRARRRRETVENDAYTAFCSRIIRAAGRRIAAGDVEGLPEMLALERELDQAIGDAVRGLRGFGYSWGEIASRLKISRQAAQQRWGGDR